MDTTKPAIRILTGVTKHGPAASYQPGDGNPTIQRWHYWIGKETERLAVVVGALCPPEPIRVRCKIQRQRLAAAGAVGWRE
jgi:hypothetical protein